MTTANYYRLLALQPTASTVEIKRQYRQLSFKYHPDRGGSVEKMTQLNEAYRVLSNGLLRREYDRHHGTRQAATSYNDVVRPHPQPTSHAATATESVYRAQTSAQPRHTQAAPSRKQWSWFWTWAGVVGVFAFGFFAYQLYALIQPSTVATSSPAAINSPSSQGTTTSDVSNGGGLYATNGSASTSSPSSTHQFRSHRRTAAKNY